MSTFSHAFLEEAIAILGKIDPSRIEAMAAGLARARADGGRLFILGVGGSAAHASHAVNDFRKICGFEAYSPTDNVAELTAHVNDEGWDTVFVAWLKVSRLGLRDALLIFSVGGGDVENNVSSNLVKAIHFAKAAGAAIYCIVGRDGGYAGRTADVAVIVPPLVRERITPHTEGLAAVIWHLLVSHPALQLSTTRWESVAAGRP